MSGIGSSLVSPPRYRSHAAPGRVRKAKRTRIIDAAMRHFAEHGYHAARVGDIAAALGIAKGSIFQHFGSKDGLFFEVYKKAVRSFPSYLDAPAEVRERGFLRGPALLAGADRASGARRLDSVSRLAAGKLRHRPYAEARDQPLSDGGRSYGTVAFVRFGLQRGELRNDLDHGDDRFDSRLDDGAFSGCAADRGTRSRPVSPAGRVPREERSAHPAVSGCLAAAIGAIDALLQACSAAIIAGTCRTVSMHQTNVRSRTILASYNDQAPLPEASTIPAPWYVDRTHRRTGSVKTSSAKPGNWSAALDQVEKPGQFVTATVAGEPIVVVRGNDGVLRAFYNVCRHHAAAVVTEPCGQASILHCPYHGWNYGLDGSLKGHAGV